MKTSYAAKKARERNFAIFRLEGIKTNLLMMRQYSKNIQKAIDSVEAALRDIRGK